MATKHKYTKHTRTAHLKRLLAQADDIIESLQEDGVTVELKVYNEDLLEYATLHNLSGKFEICTFEPDRDEYADTCDGSQVGHSATDDPPVGHPSTDDISDLVARTKRQAWLTAANRLRKIDETLRRAGLPRRLEYAESSLLRMIVEDELTASAKLVDEPQPSEKELLP